MKKIINYFIRYHVAVNVIIIAFLLFGILGVKSLKSSFFPLTESHLVQIAVSYPGASPMEIEEGYPYVTIQCQKTREGAPPWNKYNVIAITNPQIEEPLAAHPICMDPYARVYIQERP